MAERSAIGSKRGLEKRLSPTQTESKPASSTTSVRSSRSARE
jgi:hypothetical protein